MTRDNFVAYKVVLREHTMNSIGSNQENTMTKYLFALIQQVMVCTQKVLVICWITETQTSNVLNCNVNE